MFGRTVATVTEPRNLRSWLVWRRGLLCCYPLSPARGGARPCGRAAVTAELHATAAGLIARSAAAYVSGVPDDAADDDMYSYGAPQPLTPGRRTEIRQSLGVLDAVFLGEPGVLEARQRITLRMRTARPA